MSESSDRRRGNGKKKKSRDSVREIVTGGTREHMKRDNDVRLNSLFMSKRDIRLSPGSAKVS